MKKKKVKIVKVDESPFKGKKLTDRSLKEIQALRAAVTNALSAFQIAKAEHDLARAKMERRLREALLEINVPLNVAVNEITGEIVERAPQSQQP